MFVSDFHRALRRHMERAGPLSAPLWALLLAACGGGGGGGGGPVVASAPVATPDPAAKSSQAPKSPTPADPAMPDSMAQRPDGQETNRQLPQQSSREQERRQDDSAESFEPAPEPARLDILPLVSLPRLLPDSGGGWIKVADIRAVDADGAVIRGALNRGDWSFNVGDSRFRADDTGLYARAGSDFSRSVSADLQLQVTATKGSSHRISKSVEIEVVNRTETLDLHIYENHPFHKPIGYLTKAAGWRLADSEGDNGLFHVDSTGRVWFIGTADTPLLDYERPADSDGNNLYHLRLVRSVDGREEAMNLSVRVHDIVNERNWAQRNDYRGLLGASREADHHDEVPDDLEHIMHGSHWLMPSSGPLVLTWSLRTLFSPDQTNAGSRPSRAELAQAEGWTPRAGGRINADNSFLDTVQEIESLRNALNKVFAEIQSVINIRFVEVDEAPGSMGHFRVWLFSDPDGGTTEARTLGQARYPMGYGLKYIKLLNGEQVDLGHLIPHEVGHMLGLKHPWDDTYHGWNTDGRPKQWSKFRPDTVMSYNRVKNEERPGWKDIDFRILKLLYGSAEGSDDPSDHVPLAARVSSGSSRPRAETDLVKIQPYAGLLMYSGTSYEFFPHHLTPGDMGTYPTIRFRIMSADNRPLPTGWVPELLGEDADLFEIRKETRLLYGKPQFGIYIKDVAKLDFGEGGFSDHSLTIWVSPQTQPRTIKLRIIHDLPLQGELLIKGYPAIKDHGGVMLSAVTDLLLDPDAGPYGFIKPSQFSFAWRRKGEDTILSDSINFHIDNPGEYELSVTYTDPKWKSKQILMKSFTVHDHSHDPRMGYDVVSLVPRFDERTGKYLPESHIGTARDEWFDIKSDIEVAGGGGSDVFALHWPSVITDFTKGEDKISINYRVNEGPIIVWRRVDTNKDKIVDSVHFETATFGVYHAGSLDKTKIQTPVLFDYTLKNFTGTLEETDFLTDGSDLVLIQLPDVI